MTCPLRNPCGLQLAPPNKAKLNLRKQQTLSEVSKRDASVGLLGSRIGFSATLEMLKHSTDIFMKGR